MRLAAGELLHIEYSYKYGGQDVEELAGAIGMEHMRCWSDAAYQCDVHLFRKQAATGPAAGPEGDGTSAGPAAKKQRVLSVLSHYEAQLCRYSPQGVASGLYAGSELTLALNPGSARPRASGPPLDWAEWQEVYNMWDTASLAMVPPGRHTDRPIKLRMPCAFYVGHMPAFSDILLSR